MVHFIWQLVPTHSVTRYSLMKIVLLCCCIASCWSLLGLQRITNSALRDVRSRIPLQLPATGYIPPELDPEYRNIVVRPRASYEFNQSDPNSEKDFTAYPVPKEGDVVQYRGRWNETSLGRIRYLRYVDTYEGFYADIVPLVEGKSDDVFVVDRTASSEFINVEELVPVRSYFVRAENGNKVYYSKTEPRIVVLKAPRFKKLEKDFTPRTKASVARCNRAMVLIDKFVCVRDVFAHGNVMISIKL